MEMFCSNSIVRSKSPSEVCKQNHTSEGKAGSSLWPIWELYLHRSKGDDSLSRTVSNSLRFQQQSLSTPCASDLDFYSFVHQPKSGPFFCVSDLLPFPDFPFHYCAAPPRGASWEARQKCGCRGSPRLLVLSLEANGLSFLPNGFTPRDCKRCQSNF